MGCSKEIRLCESSHIVLCKFLTLRSSVACFGNILDTKDGGLRNQFEENMLSSQGREVVSEESLLTKWLLKDVQYLALT